jgi:SPP1 family predicted phage head-tail adaptor
VINAGQYTERLTIEAPSSSVDALGQRVETWSTVVTVWGRALPQRGREQFAAGQMGEQSPVFFEIRYRTGITRNMRVVWNGAPYALVADPVQINGQKWALELSCMAGIRDGR